MFHSVPGVKMERFACWYTETCATPHLNGEALEL